MRECATQAQVFRTEGNMFQTEGSAHVKALGRGLAGTWLV